MKVILLLILLFCSCKSSNEVLLQETKNIRQRSYIPHVYDCSNMSYDLCKNLERKGFDSRIIIYRHETGKHAIVEVILNHEVVYLDPTSKFLKVSKPRYKILSTWTLSQLYSLDKNEFYKIAILNDFKNRL